MFQKEHENSTDNSAALQGSLMETANKNLMKLKELNDNLVLLVIDQFTRVKLPMDYVKHLENAISSLHLTEEELAELNPFYDYETMIYGCYHTFRDKMNVFDRQVESIPYHDLSATQLNNLNGLIENVITKFMKHSSVIQQFTEGSEYQKMMEILADNKMDVQTQIVELIDLVGLNKIESRDDETNKKHSQLKAIILAEIGRIGRDMLNVIAAFKTSDGSRKIFESYDEIVNMERDLPTKIDFSFIRV